MANIWMDNVNTNENRGQPFASNAKQFMSARKHSSKKQVFGELKNVIHNQGGATPFKGTVKKIPVLMGSSKLPAPSSLCSDVLRKQQLKQNFWEAQKQLEKKLKPVKIAPSSIVTPTPTPTPTPVAAPVAAPKFSIAEDAPWYNIELSVNKCSGDCHKSLEEIWGETNMIDDAFLQKVINGGDPDLDGEDDKDDYPKESDDELANIDVHELLSKPLQMTPEEEESRYDDSRPPFEFEMPKHDELLDFDFAF